MNRAYKKATPEKRRKRGGDEARRDGLIAARNLLLSGGPAAVTLANVGRAIGMSHTNVIHHFGSAADLQSALMGSMIEDLTKALDHIVDNVRDDEAAPIALIESVFDAFDRGGAGHLAAWIALSRDNQQLAPVRDAVRQLITAFSEKHPGYETQVQQAVLMLAICAFGDSVIGPQIREMVDAPDNAMRTIATKAFAMFLVE